MKYEVKCVIESVRKENIPNAIISIFDCIQNNREGFIDKINIVKNKDGTFDINYIKLIFQ